MFQCINAGAADLDDKVIAAGHAVALQDLRFALDHFKEMVPFRYRRLDGNQRLDSVILAGVVQAHGIAADDALLLHAVDTAGHRRTGQVDLFGDFLDRHAGVAHHKLDDFAV